MVLSKIELQFDTNRSPSTVVKTIKKYAFLKSFKKSRWVRYRNVLVTTVRRNKLSKKNLTIVRSVVLPAHTNKNISFKPRRFLEMLAFLDRSDERGPFGWVRYHAFPSFWNRHSSSERDENFSETRTCIYPASVKISALCHLKLLSYDNSKVKNGWVRYLWTGCYIFSDKIKVWKFYHIFKSICRVRFGYGYSSPGPVRVRV